MKSCFSVLEMQRLTVSTSRKFHSSIRFFICSVYALDKAIPCMDKNAFAQTHYHVMPEHGVIREDDDKVRYSHSTGQNHQKVLKTIIKM